MDENTTLRNRKSKFQEVYGKQIEEDEEDDFEVFFEKIKNYKRELPNVKSTYQYLKLTLRESRRSKITYCLGCLACFIVVFVVALMVTILSHTPIVFLRLSELQQGEIDIIISTHDNQGYDFVNYTLCENLLIPFPDYAYTSPRLQSSKINYFNPLICDPLTKYVNFTEWAYKGIEGATYSNCTETGDCFNQLCDTSYTPPTYIIDSIREKRMGVGREFPKSDPIPQNQIYLSRNLAEQIGVRKNDRIYLSFKLSDLFLGLWNKTVTDFLNSEEGELYTLDQAIVWSNVFVPYTVNWTFRNSEGKSDNTLDDLAFIEYSLFVSSFSKYLNPDMPSTLVDQISNWDLYQYAERVLVNYPPDRRMDVYTTSDIDSINRLLVDFASNLAYGLGFNLINIDMPVLVGLNDIQIYALFMGLILNVITFILLFLSIILIYSLLMVSVETRTFEMGILRMVGMSRTGVIQLLLLQAFTYSFPAWSIGLIAAQISSIFAGMYFETITGVDIDAYLTIKAFIAATILGSFVPAVSSLLPIKNALGVNLHDAIDIHHSKSKAVEVNVERSEDSSFSWSLFTIGMFLAGFGFAIYYIIPLSLLSAQFTMLLNMFFTLLIMMLLGLVLLSLNAQRLLEKFIVNVMFWWDKAAVRTVVLKNMIAHRKRNRKTTIMYALSLGFIIFIYVSYDIQMNTIIYAQEWSRGTTITVYSNSVYGIPLINELETYLEDNPLIESYAWSTQYLNYAVLTYNSVKMTNLGHVNYDYNSIYGVTPSFFDTVEPGFLNINTQNDSSPFSLIEQLHTPLGTGSALIGSLYKKKLSLESLDDQFLIEADYATKEESGVKYFRLKSAATLDSSPVFRLSRFPTSPNQDIIVSLPTYLLLCKDWIHSLEDVAIRTVYIQTTDYTTSKELDNMKKVLKEISKSSVSTSVYDYRSSLEIIEQVNLAMTFFFGFTVVMAMAISFFSLISSMYTNVLEQSKEIGILRAMGIPFGWMQRIYVIEAFTLVFSSSMMGMIIGVSVGWTVAIQQVVFTQFPVTFRFPYELFGFVFALSVIFSIFASYGPITKLMNQSIVAIFRKV